MANLTLTGSLIEPCDTCGPSNPPTTRPLYQPGVVQEVFCYELLTDPKGGCALSGVRSTGTTVDGDIAQELFDDTGGLLDPATIRVVRCPDKVAVCPSPGKQVNMVDCAGVTTATPVGDTVQTVPHPSAVQMVRICPDPDELDREVSLWCEPVTGTQVTVVTFWPETSPPGTQPVVEAYLLNGTPYGGNIALLEKCVSTDYEVVTVPVCVDGVQFIRTTFFDAKLQTVTGTVWQDQVGDVVATPTGTMVEGQCPTKEEIFSDSWVLTAGQSMDGSDILAATGATTLRAVALHVRTGTADVAGRTTVVTLLAGETQAWSANGAGQEDALGAEFSVFAVTGAVRITASYVI